MKKSSFVARAGMIAAVYAALTLLTVTFLQGLAWGPVQLRVSEATCVLAVLTPAAVPGLAIGCVLANLLSIPLTGSGLLGLLDVVFGSLATLLGALWTRRFRGNLKVALLGPVIANALIVPAYLPILVKGYGFYTIPFTSVDIEGAFLPMYLFGVLAIGLGEAAVLYGIGFPLVKGLRRSGVLADDDEGAKTLSSGKGSSSVG